MKKILRLILIIWVVGFVCFVIWHHLTYGPRTRAKVPQLEAASALVTAPPEDQLVHRHVTSKSGQVLVDRTYQSQRDYAALRAFYDSALTAHGWIFDREKPVHEWGKDLGGKTARYRRGEDCASLQYAGEKANHGWTYSLSFTWDWTGCR